MIARIPFGRTGHASSRVIFGAAALGAMRQERADALLPLLLEFGVNHIDTAEGYGDSELRLAPWLRRHRADFFVATKTRARDAEGARASLERSLERMEIDRVDLIQLHNLVDPSDWEQAFAPGGAVEGLVAARDAGLTRFLGVTGHGWNVPAMHRRSLERFAFDSILLPYNWSMLSQAEHRAELERVLTLCRERGVAVQTIKSVARRRWQDPPPERRFSWYEALPDGAALRRAVALVLAQPDLFLNSSSDARLLRPILEAARDAEPAPEPAALDADARQLGIEPLFEAGQDVAF